MWIFLGELLYSTFYRDKWLFAAQMEKDAYKLLSFGWKNRAKKVMMYEMKGEKYGYTYKTII